MSFTPRMVVFAARGALALAVAGAATCMAIREVLPPVVLAAFGFAAALLTLLSFPKIRRNELLSAVAAGGAVTGYVLTPGWSMDSLMAAGIGLCGPVCVALTMSVVRIRNLAASNWHMSFVEWRQFDRRRKNRTQANPALPDQYAHHTRTS